MKLSKVKVTVGLSLAAIFIMSGCGGGSSNPPVPDTVAPVFTNTQTNYDVMEGLSVEINASAIDDRGGVVKYSEDHAEFIINNLGILTLSAQVVSSDSSFSVTVTATDEANNSATKNIRVRVKDKGIENRTVMPETNGRVFRDRKDGTVVNTHTGFLWERNATAGKSYDSAKDYCDRLDLAGITWKLPTRMDLNKLINYTFPIKFDKEFSQNSGQYWTDEINNSTTAWSISFTGSGGDNIISKDEANIWTRCVSGVHKSANFDGNHTDDERFDNDTRLTWKITKPTVDVNFTTAQSSCEAPDRLPTFNELLSIVEFFPKTVLGVEVDEDLGDTISSASIEKGFGRNMWTSTGYEENDVNKTKVLYITPAEISDGGIEKNATAGIICVK